MIYPFVLYPWILILAYGKVGSVLGHDWEVYSSYFFFWFSSMLILITVLYYINIQVIKLIKYKYSQTIIHTILLCIMLVFFIGPRTNNLFSFLKDQDNSFWIGSRHKTYTTISKWINENIPKKSKVALEEVGTIGYYTDVNVIDLCGLITKTFENGRKMSFIEILNKFQPLYIIIKKRSLKKFNYKNANYIKIKEFKKKKFIRHIVLKRVNTVNY